MMVAIDTCLMVAVSGESRFECRLESRRQSRNVVINFGLKGPLQPVAAS